MNNKTFKIVTILFTIILLWFVTFSWADSSETSLITINKNEKKSFAPVRGEKWLITAQIRHAESIKQLSLEIRSSDNDLIQTLALTPVKSKKNTLQAIWDGKDSENNVVPNEAYYPVIVLITKADKEITIDSRQNSGGEEVYNFDKNINQGVIEYTLPVASRILIRAGIKNGPMLRTITDWEVKSAGFHTQRWDGWDKDKTIALEQHPEIGYLIIGYQLPDHTIITYGNSKESYRTYRERKKWPVKQVQTKDQQLTRAGKVIRSEFYHPVLQQKSPRINVNLIAQQTKKSVTHVNDFEEFITQVKLHPLDEMYLDQERYEISFFIDNNFIAEEEQGFVPYTWRWSPARLGIKPGKHILTINVSGYSGQVGVKNIPFTLTNSNKEQASQPITH